MPNLNDYEDSDELYNPVTRSIAKKEQDAVAGNSSNTSSEPTSSSAAQKLQNEETAQGFYRPDDNKPDYGASRTVSLKTILKKRGPLAALITLGLGLPSIIAIVLSPALALQQFAEMLTDEFNDQLGALDVRSTYLLKKKYHSTLTKGSCGTVTIRCKYRTIRENSGLAKRLHNAGVTIEGDKSIVPGRIKPTHFVFEGKRIPAKDLVKEASRNVALQKALRKGYDPLYAGFSDRKAADIRTRLGIKRSSDVKSSSDKEKMDEELKETAAGENNIPDDGEKLTVKEDADGPVTDADGKPIYVDSDGKEYTEAEAKRINNLIEESFDRNQLAEKAGKTAAKSTLKGVLTSTAFGAGAVDSLCTAWTVVRVAGFAAKVYQQKQLIRYSYEFLKVAHKQKYGDLTAEEADFWFGKLTKTNSEGKGGLDSDGYKFAAYGDTFNPASYESDAAKLKEGDVSDKDVEKIELQNETSRYVNGQVVSTNLMGKIAGAVSGAEGSAAVSAADSTCKFTKSWKGQALVFGLAAAGAVVAFFTGGASISVGAIAQGAASVAISVVFALIQPKLIDMAKGEVIQGDENGNEASNAAVSGAGGLNAQFSPGRGLGVATQETYQAYNQLNTEVAAKYAEYDREDRSPLDPTSKNTFLGSIMANLTPYIAKNHTVGTAGLSMFSFVTSNIASLGIGKKVYAADTAEKYNQCDDPEYDEENLAADPFCNLRYAIPVSDLSIDPDTVLDYMINNNYVSEEDATPQGDYADYVGKCFDRENSIGDGQTDTSEGDGKECIIGKGGDNEERNKMFRLFYLDTSVDDGMEEDFDSANPETTGGVDLKIASFNVRGASHDGEDGTTSYDTRIKRTVDVINSEGFDVIGFQEFENKQRTEFVNALGGTYSLSNKDAGEDNGNGIAWNTSKFDLIGQGTQPNLKYTVGNTLKAPWVKLKDKTTQQVFYFMNTHDPANVHDKVDVTRNAARRTENAKEHVKFMQEKAAEGVPVLMSGDFNSAFNKRSGDKDANVTNQNISETLPYCIMTSGGTIQNAFDMYKGRQVKCPNKDIDWNKEDPGKGCTTQIDHLYILPGSQPAEVSEFGCIRKGDTKETVEAGNGSDHDTVKFAVSIGGSAQNSGAGTDFVIGTYNQKCCRSDGMTEDKQKKAAQNMVDNGMDVIGTQESSNPKFSTYKSYLGNKGYEIYPSYAGKNQTCSNAQAILFKKSKFKLLKGEYFEIPRYPDPAVNCGNGEKTTASHNEDGLPAVWTHIPIIWLQDVSTSQTIIVINTHNVANVKGAKGTQPAKSRWRSAQIYIDQIRRLKSQNPGIPIFMTGDFNEGTGVRPSKNITYQGEEKNLFFCMLAETGLMKSAAGPAMKCDGKNGQGGVDYIYVTPEVKVDWDREIASGGQYSDAPSYTDHPVRYAHVTVPGSGSGNNPSVGSDIDGDDYKSECSKYLAVGDCTGECVGFVKFRLVKHGVIKPRSLGNGGSVTATLRGAGFKVDTTPAVNSVMSLRHNSVGHTAMVSQVNKDGSIIVEEYNWDVDHGYAKRKISAATLNAQRKAGTVSFAHTEVKYK